MIAVAFGTEIWAHRCSCVCMAQKVDGKNMKKQLVHFRSTALETRPKKESSISKTIWLTVKTKKLQNKRLPKRLTMFKQSLLAIKAWLKHGFERCTKLTLWYGSQAETLSSMEFVAVRKNLMPKTAEVGALHHHQCWPTPLALYHRSSPQNIRKAAGPHRGPAASPGKRHSGQDFRSTRTGKPWSGRNLV